MFKYTQDLGSIEPYFPTYISKRGIKSGIKNLSKYIANHLSGDVVVPIIAFYEPSGQVKFPITIRSKYENLLPGAKATFMETKDPSDKFKEMIFERMGRKGQTLLDLSYDCSKHEAWNYTNFKKIASDLLVPRTAWEYVVLPKGEKKFTISGLILEQKMDLPYSWNKEVSKIEKITPEELKKILYSQIDLLIPKDPPNNRVALRWIADEVVNPVAISNRTWDFAPYNKSIKAFKRKKAQGVLAMPPSKNGITTNFLDFLNRYR